MLRALLLGAAAHGCSANGDDDSGDESESEALVLKLMDGSASCDSEKEVYSWLLDFYVMVLTPTGEEDALVVEGALTSDVGRGLGEERYPLSASGWMDDEEVEGLLADSWSVSWKLDGPQDCPPRWEHYVILAQDVDGNTARLDIPEGSF